MIGVLMNLICVAKVVYSEQEAHDLGLAIDHDDTHAAKPPKQSIICIDATRNTAQR